MPKRPSEESLSRMRKLVTSFTKKSGTTTHPEKEVTELVVLGLARHVDELGKALVGRPALVARVELASDAGVGGRAAVGVG